MGLYSRYLLPRIVDRVCAHRTAMRQRERLVPLAEGRVLEVGAGSGLNLPLYDGGRVERVIALEPSVEIWALADERVAAAAVAVTPLIASAESIPLERGSVDTVVVTYSLCTIPDAAGAVREMRRVLRDDGRLLFCEHGRAPDLSTRRWQRRLNPIWRRFGGGCRLDRDIPAIVEQGGFTMRAMEAAYLPGLRPASFNYRGVAS